MCRGRRRRNEGGRGKGQRTRRGTKNREKERERRKTGRKGREAGRKGWRGEGLTGSKGVRANAACAKIMQRTEQPEHTVAAPPQRVCMHSLCVRTRVRRVRARHGPARSMQPRTHAPRVACSACPHHRGMQSHSCASLVVLASSAATPACTAALERCRASGLGDECSEATDRAPAAAARTVAGERG